MLDTYRREILVFLVGLVVAGGGVFWVRSQKTPETSIEVIKSTKSDIKDMFVDVSGAVERPGVYKLTDGRVEDALNAAGGITGDADIEWVEKNLNKAAQVSDGQKIYVPRKGEEHKSQKININEAGQGELEGLPGVGPVTAGKIIAGRPYNRADELLERKIVGQKVFEQIKDLIEIW